MNVIGSITISFNPYQPMLTPMPLDVAPMQPPSWPLPALDATGLSGEAVLAESNTALLSLLQGLLENFEEQAACPNCDGQPVVKEAGSALRGSDKLPPPAPVEATDNMQDTRGWVPINAARTNSPGDRSADEYSSVIDQFDVENNPRYTPRVQNPGGPMDTFCNIFVSDVTRAMGADIPHYWEGQELDANRTADWLRDHGQDFGWAPVSEQEAQAMANQGKPVVVAWNNPNGIGHVGMVRPGEINGNGPALAQAGAENLNNAHVRDTFGDAGVVYYAHA
jgi:hypothetical protein